MYKKTIIILIGSFSLLFLIYYTFILYKKNVLSWLPNYINFEIKKNFEKETNATKHIMLLLADHHEITKTNDELLFLEKLKKLSNKHLDGDGKKLQYTFFYPYDHFFRPDFDTHVLSTIVKYCSQGYGDIELHWHLKNETSASYRDKLRDAIKRFNKYGALITVDNKVAYGFIHGNWALDNSIISEKGENYSGVNNELDILRESNCFADFTFPAFGTTAQPSLVNNIYYALDDPLKPKSYDTGILVEARKKKPNDKYFMIFSGLIIIRPFVNGKILYIDRSNIQDSELPSPKRAENWIKNGISIKGQPSWIFIKLHMHGGLHPDAILGKDMDRTLNFIENKYNDGKEYKLHYVTAREAYNIVKAAESGFKGDPNIYRNFLIKPYKYNENG
jgi:hypothetical protein